MADTTIDLLKNSSYVGKMDELIAAVKLGGSATSDVEWNDVKNKPTTITQICDDVITNSAVDELVNTTNTKSATTETNINSALGKISPLNTRDNSFIMENLIDLIDYKMQIIRSLISNM